ncbi:MAG TPA: outer membrane lipoprotein carrier protein LolA [Gemmatimonadaceae bacterium]
MISRSLSPRVLAIVLAIGGAGATTALAQASTAGPAPRRDLLDRAVAAWAGVKTARATFEQTIENPLTGRTLTASGEYQQRRPGLLSVQFEQPANDRIVADGKYVWMYLPSTTPGQVMRSRLNADGTGTVDLTAQFLTAPRSRFTVQPAGTLDVSGRATHAYTLVPKSSASAPFTTATVYIDDADASIRQFVVTEPNGVRRTVRLTSFKPNVPVDAAAFTFTPPPGTRVVDR